MDGKDLYSCFIRLHVLHHACQEPIFGVGIIEELAGHGYRLSPGTLYPLLHGLEEKGYLRSSEESDGGRSRRVYWATPKGRKALAVAKIEVRELFAELLDEKNQEDGSRHKAVVAGDLIREIAAQLKLVTLPRLRRGVGKVTEPEAHALLETSAEIVVGLIKALDHYEKRSEA
jgi:DNA-binding PadR family transcriptional regulator